MTLPWLDLKEVRKHAGTLVEDLHRIKTGGVARGDKLTMVSRRMEKTLEEAAQFERSGKLNVYKKAQLLSAVREGLTGKAWPSADIDAIIHQMLTYRLRKPSKS